MVHLRPKVVCGFFHAFSFIKRRGLNPQRGDDPSLPQLTLRYVRPFFCRRYYHWSDSCPLLLFIFLIVCVLFLLLFQYWSQFRTLSVGIGKYEKMAKSGRRSPVKGRPYMKPQEGLRAVRGQYELSMPARKIIIMPREQSTTGLQEAIPQCLIHESNIIWSVQEFEK